MAETRASADVTYNSDDFLAFARRIAGRRLRYYRTASLALALLMVVTLAIDWVMGQRLPLWQTECGILAAAGLWLLSTGRLQGRAVAKHARKIGATNPQVFKVDEEGFHASGASETSLTKWSDIPEIDLVEERLFVVVAGNKAFIVPRRAFSTDGAFNAFVGAARAHWAVRHRL